MLYKKAVVRAWLAAEYLTIITMMSTIIVLILIWGACDL